MSEKTTTTNPETGLEDAHEAWDIEVERVSEKTVITAKREEFYPNGASESIVTLDHPAKQGWQVLGLGRRECRWEARYESGVEAIDVFTTLTHIYESRRTIKQEQPASSVTRAYYDVEGLLLGETDADEGERANRSLAAFALEANR